jgi:hypothetical protein
MVPRNIDMGHSCRSDMHIVRMDCVLCNHPRAGSRSCRASILVRELDCTHLCFGYITDDLPQTSWSSSISRLNMSTFAHDKLMCDNLR